MSVTVHGDQREPLSIEDRVDAYEREARAWHARYRRPFWVAETSNLGLAVEDGPRWLDRLVGGLDRLRADGLPARGPCWYSRGDQYDWHTMLTKPVGEVEQVVGASVADVPDPPGSLYIRPTLVGTEQNIGAAARPSQEAPSWCWPARSATTSPGASAR